MLITLFKFLHLATMFIAVSAILGADWLGLRLTHMRDVRAIHVILRQARSIERVGPLLFALANVFGVVTAWLGNLDLLARWLVISYALVILIIINDRVNLGRWISKLEVAADASSLDAPSSELRRQISDRRALFAFLADSVLIILAVLVMVVKPGGN